MMRSIRHLLACLCAISLLGSPASVDADDVAVPGETYTPELIGPSIIDSYADRQAQGGGQGSPPSGEPWEEPLDGDPELPNGEPTPQAGGELTGSPPSLALNFLGTIREDSFADPPDTMGAIGPSYFMEVTNLNVSIFQKSSGQRVSSETLMSFFSGVGGEEALSDPRVLFDSHSGRWIIAATKYSGGGKIVLAVSISDDPTGAFFKTSAVSN